MLEMEGVLPRVEPSNLQLSSADDEGDSKAALVSQAHGQFINAESPGQLRGSAVEADVRFTPVIAPDFDLLPPHIADASAQSFGDSLLGRPPGCQGFGAAGTVITLSLGKDPFEKAGTMPRERALDPPDLNQIDAYDQHVTAEKCPCVGVKRET